MFHGVIVVYRYAGYSRRKIHSVRSAMPRTSYANGFRPPHLVKSLEDIDTDSQVYISIPPARFFVKNLLLERFHFVDDAF